jgi:hypothetical protein
MPLFGQKMRGMSAPEHGNLYFLLHDRTYAIYRSDMISEWSLLSKFAQQYYESPSEAADVLHSRLVAVAGFSIVGALLLLFSSVTGCYASYRRSELMSS